MRCDLLIRNGTVVFPDETQQTDIAISDGKIVEIGPSLSYTADREIDGKGQYVFPGIIETHAHMLLPFGGTFTMNDFYDGTRAGAFGGVTTLIDFADQIKGRSVLEAYDKRRKQTDGNCAVDYSLHCTLTDINDETIAAIPKLVEMGITSFKFYTAYSAGGLFVPMDQMKRAFEEVARCGALATVHAEKESILLDAMRMLRKQGKTLMPYFVESRPAEAEEAAVFDLVELCRQTGAALLIRHVSSEAGVRLICGAQQEGLPVYGETCPHYLYLTREVYDRPDAADYIVNPPIRGEADREALWNALKQGAAFTIGTDDCAFYRSQKRVSSRFMDIPGGFSGIETRFLIMYELGIRQRGLSLPHLSRLMSYNPSRLYGLFPRKGVLMAGADADLFLVDPTQTTTISSKMMHEKTDYTVFEGFQAHAAITYTVSNGKIIVDHGADLTEKGAGRWIARSLPRKAVSYR